MLRKRHDSRKCEDKVVIWVLWFQYRCESDRFVFADDVVQLRRSIVKACFGKLFIIDYVKELHPRRSNDTTDKDTTGRNRVCRIIILSIGNIRGSTDVDNSDVLESRFEITVGRSRRIAVAVSVTISVKS